MQQPKVIYLYDPRIAGDVHRILNRQRGAPLGILLALCFGVVLLLGVFGQVVGFMTRWGF